VSFNPARFSVANRAFVNAVFVLVIALGVWSLMTIPRELNPRVGFNWAFVTVIWPGATPQEVEDLVTIPLEDEVFSVEDVDVITSNSRSGSGFVWVKFEQISEAEFERRLDDVRARVIAVDLPEDAEDPIVESFSSYDFQPVVTVAVHGDVPERTLHDTTRWVEDELRSLDGVADVESFGMRDRAVVVEVDPLKLEAHGLDAADVESALRLTSLNLPAGVIKLGGLEYLLRTRSKVEGAEDVARVALRAGRDGRRLLVGDVATVRDGFKDRTVSARFNGDPAVTLALTKNERGNTLRIASDVRDLVERVEPRLPPGVSLAVTNDESLLVDIILGVLESNALIGLLLVAVMLFLFVGWRGALVAVLGIPVTFLLAVMALDWSGFSLNGNTLFGLILVLGMVVDDAIVILENAFRHLQDGKNPGRAVIDGVAEVASPVAISTFTTLAGFLPLVLMTGVIGKFMRIIPITVALVLLASLIEAFWILPSHFVDVMGLLRKKSHEKTNRTGLDRLRDEYVAMLNVMLRWRYAVLPAAVIMLIGSLFLIPLIGVELFATDEYSTVQIQVTMPDGTRLEATDAVVERFESMAAGLPDHELEAVIGNSGILQTADEWQFGSHVGQVWVDLVEATDRDRSVAAIIEDLRQRAAAIPGPLQLEFRSLESGPPSDAPIELLVKGENLDELAAASEAIQDVLRELPGTADVRDDLDLRQPQLDVVVDREAAARYGLDPTRIAMAVRAAFADAEVTTFRDGDEEVDVVVRWPEPLRRTIDDVRRLRFASPSGEVVPFASVASVEERFGPLLIRRHERERAVTVMSDLDGDGADMGAINAGVMERWQDLRTLFPGARIEPGGQFREFWEAFEDLARLFAIGLLLNFMLMAGQFKNWSQPLVIMSVVPLSFIGAMVGLMISRAPFSIATLYGFVALAGVAVNDSIVLLDFVNRLRRGGLDRWESLREAGRLRLRPILLTTVTTIFGLLPMALGLGGSSQTWQPLASTIVAGLAVATGMCLLVIPCMQAVVDDLGVLWRRFWARGDSAAEAELS
jgi:multidrug efflux pump